LGSYLSFIIRLTLGLEGKSNLNRFGYGPMC